MVPGVTQVHCGYSPSTATRASLAVKRARGPRKQFQATQLKLSRSRLRRLIQFLFMDPFLTPERPEDRRSGRRAEPPKNFSPAGDLLKTKLMRSMEKKAGSRRRPAAITMNRPAAAAPLSAPAGAASAKERPSESAPAGAATGKKHKGVKGGEPPGKKPKKNAGHKHPDETKGSKESADMARNDTVTDCDEEFMMVDALGALVEEAEEKQTEALGNSKKTDADMGATLNALFGDPRVMDAIRDLAKTVTEINPQSKGKPARAPTSPSRARAGASVEESDNRPSRVMIATTCPSLRPCQQHHPHRHCERGPRGPQTISRMCTALPCSLSRTKSRRK